MRAILVLFEAMSGLKVNFNKSMLVGVIVSDSWLNEAASVLHCRVGKVLFVYLGLSIGGDPRRLIFWEPLLRSIKSRLSGFNSRFLSFDGRLVLLKSVLTSLPVYAFSFFKAPSGIISSLDSIFTIFFGGDVRIIGSSLGSVGPLFVLGWSVEVWGLREFNVALLGKLCWRLLVERSSLWYRVLVTRYVEEDGRLVVGDRSGSSWWREIANIKDGVSGVGGGWFQEGLYRLAGDGVDTFFWHDLWLGAVSFCVHFRRLFDLAIDKSCTVTHMFSSGLEIETEVVGVGGGDVGGVRYFTS
ncbi:hypothetical protein MtrunA17_Chr8g0363541 [Medicago truncatula]|uniref:Uncharacterized protein n=1 Tax=Medicago truncatula TaxID=3880 RepID=A0A396GKZ7_MEDTR|nr:hypothetical protein MtrunA17_Chr8g0363541 [Medicago truncatula]